MDNEELTPRTGNYKNLISYQKAEAIFDITYYFCLINKTQAPKSH